jgi:hypothetical protein
VRIIEETKNSLLQQKAALVTKAGDVGRIAIFVQQHLHSLFEAYEEHASQVRLDNMVVMDEEDAMDKVVNRGPHGLVEFLPAATP